MDVQGREYQNHRGNNVEVVRVFVWHAYRIIWAFRRGNLKYPYPDTDRPDFNSMSFRVMGGRKAFVREITDGIRHNREDGTSLQESILAVFATT